MKQIFIKFLFILVLLSYIKNWIVPDINGIKSSLTPMICNNNTNLQKV